MDRASRYLGQVTIRHQDGTIVVETAGLLSRSEETGAWHGFIGGNLGEHVGRTLTICTSEGAEAPFVVHRVLDERQTEIQGIGPAPF